MNTDINRMAKEQFNFRLDKDLMKQVKKLADEQNRSVTNYIETLLIQAIDTSKSQTVKKKK
jgi:hypothetical protein